MGLDARLVSFAFVCSSISFCFYFFAAENSSHDYFLRPKENMGREKKTTGDANHVDEEHNRRASILLPINLVKISTSRFDSLATGWG